MSIEGKTVIVTGGTSGIGEGCSRHFVDEGAKVVIASNQAAEGEALAAELGESATFVEVDVSDEASVEALMAKTVDLHGRIDVLHSNAGVWRQGKVTDFTVDDWNVVMGVNVMGNLWLAKHAVPVMEKQGKGVICITTSVAAFVGFPEHALYCASKAALEALIRCLATDHAGCVRVVGVCPGTVDTPMLAASAAGWTAPLEELYADISKKIPVRRMGTPLDVAKAVAFLISDNAAYIDATTLVLDGGTLALPPW
ncbi:MAG TPA: SDR family oxidoreductase [Armatimonadota bacterium]|jgi:NAD(P)-dependent dehydrogenase (short-subunit alcohol dehydrogenase family)|nr:SDR family oxidoreductase [Armatimonadota bacterium]